MSRTRSRRRRPPHAAEIQRYRRRQVGDIITAERAVLPCGCAIFVGLTAERKAATRAQPCCPEHEGVTDRSSGLLREVIERFPQNRLLVETCRDVLGTAAREMEL